MASHYNLAVLRFQRVKVRQLLVEKRAPADLDRAIGIARELAGIVPAGHRVEIQVEHCRPGATRVIHVPIYACERDAVTGKVSDVWLG